MHTGFGKKARLAWVLVSLSDVVLGFEGREGGRRLSIGKRIFSSSGVWMGWFEWRISN
jgi:hypothetical protein